jgi:hypothetical protein
MWKEVDSLPLRERLVFAHRVKDEYVIEHGGPEHFPCGLRKAIYDQTSRNDAR